MNKRKVLASLSKIANNLDLMGKTNEADQITKVMMKVSNVFDDDYNEMVRKDLDEEELSDYSFSGEENDFEDDEDDFPTDDDEIVKEFNMDRTPGRSEMFENDLPGEMPRLNPLKFMKTLREELEARLPGASEEEIDEMVDEMMEKMNNMINRDIDF